MVYSEYYDSVIFLSREVKLFQKEKCFVQLVSRHMQLCQLSHCFIYLLGRSKSNIKDIKMRNWVQITTFISVCITLQTWESSETISIWVLHRHPLQERVGEAPRSQWLTPGLRSEYHREDACRVLNLTLTSQKQQNCRKDFVDLIESLLGQSINEW